MAKHIHAKTHAGIALNLLLLCAPVHAQSSTDQKITVTGQIISAPLDVGGFGDEPLSRTPIAGSAVSESRLRDAGARSVSDLTRLDAAISDAYDAEGYWSSLSVRGYLVDHRSNYRRDGLPMHGETVINLANKRGIEVLKGASGIQAGTSAPGGLINFVVKRPTTRLRSVGIDLRDSGSVALAADVSERFGSDDALGLRLNAQHERIDPAVRDAKGTRSLLALAGEARVSSRTVIEAEIESSRQSQPSVPGFSLLGNTLPDADTINPRINLNNQAWTLPVVLQGTTASLRLRHALSNDWRATVHAMTQRLRNDDRVAFPYGCSAENNFDRYCSDGSFDLYDFRSDNERRSMNVIDTNIAGTLNTGGLRHSLTAGLMHAQAQADFQRQAFNYAGIGRIDGGVQTPSAPELTDENTARNERSTELYLRDAMRITPTWSLWAGLRHTRLQRSSVRTDGSRATNYSQSFTTPWLALTHQLTPATMVYASVGQGIETDVAPNRSRYTNAGEPLPALKSRQTEVGIKHDGETLDASAAIFDIDRPIAADIGTCDGSDASCTRQVDGSARHRGIEALLSWRHGPLALHASGMLLNAQRRGANDPSQNGLRPTNVPRHTLRLHASYDVPQLEGMALMASVVHEGQRMVLPDNSIAAPGWTRLDLSLRWRQTLDSTAKTGPINLTWRLGLDNATNTRAWKETPYQFGHAYLFPIAPRTLRWSLAAAF